MSEPTRRLHGLVRLLVDAVDHGAGAIERVHLGTAKRTFDALEAIPVVSRPSKVVQGIHDVVVKGTYGTVRLVTRGVGAALGGAIELAQDAPDPAPDGGDAGGSDGGAPFA